MVNTSIDVFIKRSFLFLFLLISWASYAQQSPAIVWEYKEKEGSGEFIKADSQGNIIVVGSTDYISSLGDYSRIRIIKQDKNGNIIWQQIYVDSVTSYPDKAFDIALDTFDNIYIAGRTNFDSSVPPPDFSQSLVLKYDTHGNLLWVRKWGNNLQMGGGINRMKLFENKYVCVVGYMDSWITGYKNSFILQYDSSGVLNWADTTYANYNNFFVDVEQDKLGNSYITGVTACCLPGFDTKVLKYNLSGNIVWSKILTDSIHLYIYPKDAVIDDSANIYVGGEIKKTSGPNDYDFYLIKIDSSGNQKWFESYANTNTADWENLNGLILDYDNDCYLFGYISIGGGGQGVPVINKFKKDGSFDWSWKYDSTNGGGGGIFYDALLVQDSSLIFGGSCKSINLSQAGAFAVSFNISGIKKWIYESSNKCNFKSIEKFDTSLYATGWDYASPPTFNFDSLYICKLKFDTLNSIEKIEVESYSIIYPNPFANELNLEVSIKKDISHVSILNVFGEKILEKSSEPFRKIETNLLRNGVYIVEIIFSDNTKQLVKAFKN
ncbi:MAG: T9SS type A sorting domain-containing protein [Bacteroidetes bacterium]|nr:T9SS type A sorting domain-containing protein [Bacteroidota bacterium]